MRARTTSAAACLILLVGSVSACSSASTSSAADHGSTAPAANANTGNAGSAATSAGPGSASGGGSAKDIDVCSLLTAATISQITGTTFTTTKPDSTAGVVFGCEYDGAGADMLQISVTPNNGKIGYDADVSALTQVGHPPTKVSGVGDEAWSMPDPNGNAGSVGAAAFGSYGALFGTAYVKVGGLTYVTPDQGKQIAETLHGKL